MKLAASFGLVLGLMASPALALNCPSLPYDLTNGTTADATQVMANLNSLLSCANSQLAHNGVNSDITQLLNVTNLAFAPVNTNITSITGLTTPLSVPQGGTGANNASNARTNLGLGTAAIENLLNDIVDDGSGNLKVGNSGVTAGSYTLASITVGADGRITAASSAPSLPSAATPFQMNLGSDNVDYATPNNLQYSKNAIRAWVNWQDSGGVSVFNSYNVASVSGSSGNYTVTLSGGLTFINGGGMCSGEAATNNPLFSGPEGGLTGTNPTLTFDFKVSGGALTAPSQWATCIFFGATSN